VIVDAKGTPLAIHTTPANLRDDQAALATLDRIPKVTDDDGAVLKPKALQGDRGYGFAALISAILALLIKPLMALRGSPHGSGMGKTRYVVERTLAWMEHYRRVRTCFEKKPEHFQAFNELTVCVILAHRLRRRRRRF
jgi:transposase